MAKKQAKETMSKRQMIREQRARKARQQRLLLIGGIVVIVALLVVIVVVPTIVANNAPIGDFIHITPVAFKNVDGNKMGDPNAPVKIDVFEDFKCSACRGYHESIQQDVFTNLVDTGKAYYTFHNFPFEDDSLAVKDSDNAANAAMCAAEQNRFWDFEKILFTNVSYVTGEFSINKLEAYADSLGLNKNDFDQCLAERRYQKEIDADIQLATDWGVTGTPTVFVNGQIVKQGYVPSFADIQAAVEAASSSN
jgi:protein-disulfide isomerase